MKARRDIPEGDGEGVEDTTRCAAHGCPLRGTASIGGGSRYTCYCHSYAKPDMWALITEKIQRDYWLVELIGDVMKRPDAEAIAFAAEFWRGQDNYMVPSKNEQTRKAWYVERLLCELQYRVGARQTRPTPRDLPKPKASEQHDDAALPIPSIAPDVLPPSMRVSESYRRAA